MRQQFTNQLQLDIFSGLLNTATGALNAASGGILGIPLQALNNDMQANQQSRLMGIQMRGQEELARYNKDLQKQFWDETNYEAQVAHLKNAGLNPALLYAKGGPGGTTMPSGPSVGMGIAMPNQLAEAQQMSLAAQETQADIELKKAQASNLEANTKKTSGVDTEAVSTQIQQMKQLTTNAEIQAGILQYEQGIKSVEATVAQNSIDASIKTLHQNYEKLVQDTRAIKLSSDITEATKEQIITQARNTTIQQGLQMILTKAQTEGVITDIQATKRAIMNAVEENMRKWDTLPNVPLETRSKQFEDDLLQNQTLPNMGEKALQAISHLVIPIMGKGAKPNPIGFQQKW